MGGVVHLSALTLSACSSSGTVSVLSSVLMMIIAGHLHMDLSSLSPLVQSYPRASRISSRISPLRQSERGMASMVHAVSHSVQFSRSVMSDSLRPHGLQHARLPSPSPAPGVYSNSCPLSRRCHPTISSSKVLFSSCLQSFPASGSFQMSQFFVSGG